MCQQQHDTRWVAAVWVDPAHRRGGIGAALVAAGAAMAEACGSGPAYLCALPHNHASYRRCGWVAVETDVTQEGLAVFRPG